MAPSSIAFVLEILISIAAFSRDTLASRETLYEASTTHSVHFSGTVTGSGAHADAHPVTHFALAGSDAGHLVVH